MKRILEDIRVADLTHVWFGPWCTRILAMLGAEVITIEPPWGGLVRYRPPIFGDAGADFICMTTDKKGITLNLKMPQGKKVFFDLVKKSDVVVNNFMPGTMEKLGIAYDTLKQINPRIIYAALSGFGQTGPYSQRPSFAPIGESWAAYTRLNGDLVDPEGPPLPTTDGFGDLVPGTWAALCIIAAIRHRDRTGVGQTIDVSQIEVITHMVTHSIATQLLTGLPPWMAWKKYFPGVSGIMKASDGYVRIAAGMGPMTDRLTKVIGVDQATDENTAEWVSKRTVKEVVDTLTENDIPVGPCNSLKDVLEDPHLKARGLWVEIDDPRVGKVKLPGFPVKFSETPGELRRAAPTLSQHTEEVLSTLLGYTKEEIEQLRKDGVIK